MSVAFPFRVYSENGCAVEGWRHECNPFFFFFSWRRQPSTSLPGYNRHHALFMWETAESSVFTLKAYSASSSTNNMLSKTVF